MRVRATAHGGDKIFATIFAIFFATIFAITFCHDNSNTRTVPIWNTRLAETSRKDLTRETLWGIRTQPVFEVLTREKLPHPLCEALAHLRW